MHCYALPTRPIASGAFGEHYRTSIDGAHAKHRACMDIGPSKKLLRAQTCEGEKWRLFDLKDELDIDRALVRLDEAYARAVR